jgi:hypothetical protein
LVHFLSFRYDIHCLLSGFLRILAWSPHSNASNALYVVVLIFTLFSSHLLGCALDYQHNWQLCCKKLQTVHMSSAMTIGMPSHSFSYNTDVHHESIHAINSCHFSQASGGHMNIYCWTSWMSSGLASWRLHWSSLTTSLVTTTQSLMIHLIRHGLHVSLEITISTV